MPGVYCCLFATASVLDGGLDFSGHSRMRYLKIFDLNLSNIDSNQANFLKSNKKCHILGAIRCYFIIC